jgi:hypothetical protein
MDDIYDLTSDYLKQGHLGDDMPLTDADVEKISNMPISDGVSPASGDTLPLDQVLANDRKRLYEVAKDVNAMKADLTAIKAKLGI